MQNLRTTIAALLFGTLVSVSQATAQSVTPPAVSSYVEADYPQAARDAGKEASVDLEIIVGADGAVLDAKVTAPVGDGFDEAALAAVRKFVFTPANKDGVPTAARIQYRYTFTLSTPPPPVAIAPIEDIAPAAAVTAPPPEVVVDNGAYGAVATLEAPSREITRRSIQAAEMTKMAGTRGDALRGIELLPGVARPPGPLGAIIVRGSAPNDSQVFLDGEPVQQLYHFGGVTSFISGSLLQRIDLYPGNFSTRYGRKIGGIIETELRDPQTDRIHAQADVNMIDAFALVEGPISDTTSFAIAGRRSYVDAWIGPALDAANVGIAAVPVYFDSQAILAYKPDAKNKLRLVAYANSDDLKIVIANPSGDSTNRDHFGLGNSMYRLHGDWSHTSDRIDQRLSLAIGTRAYKVKVGTDIGVDGNVIDILGRADWTSKVSDRVELRWGLDLQNIRSNIVFDGPQIRQDEGNPDQFAPPEQVDRTHYKGVGHFFRPAAYTEAAVKPIADLSITGGVRVDYFGEIMEWAVDPRATATYARGATTFKAGVGRFSQPPEEGHALKGLGNPNLEAEHAIHYDVGVDHQFTDRISLGVEGYYKDLQHMIVAGETGMRDNTGSGTVVGLEVAGRWQPGGDFSGFLSYTLSRSERHEGDVTRLFDYDQTHILTVSGSYKLGRGWELGATFRLVSGNPETPVVGSVFDADIDAYRPIYGDVNSTRNPVFHRLDLRVEKQFHIGGHPFAGYLDLENAYNQKNRESTAYNFDYSERSDTPGLPLLPSFGIKGEI
ncbi:MAG TPA: TonB-dependent receptor [Kofleriaceae bacterium]|jgi:TonB family protein